MAGLVMLLACMMRRAGTPCRRAIVSRVSPGSTVTGVPPSQVQAGGGGGGGERHRAGDFAVCGRADRSPCRGRRPTCRPVRRWRDAAAAGSRRGSAARRLRNRTGHVAARRWCWSRRIREARRSWRCSCAAPKPINEIGNQLRPDGRPTRRAHGYSLVRNKHDERINIVAVNRPLSASRRIFE